MLEDWVPVGDGQLVSGPYTEYYQAQSSAGQRYRFIKGNLSRLTQGYDPSVGAFRVSLTRVVGWSAPKGGTKGGTKGVPSMYASFLARRTCLRFTYADLQGRTRYYRLALHLQCRVVS